MSKKDYVAIAEAIRGVRQYAANTKSHDYPYDRATCWHIATAIARVAETDNPNFNREKFLSACGFPKGMVL